MRRFGLVEKIKIQYFLLQPVSREQPQCVVEPKTYLKLKRAFIQCQAFESRYTKIYDSCPCRVPADAIRGCLL